MKNKLMKYLFDNTPENLNNQREYEVLIFN